MVPWIERPTVTLDASLPFEARFEAIPDDVLADAKMLLDAMRREMPARVRRLAPLVRARTLNRFHAEVTAIARKVNADWRDVMMANLAYDLTLAAFGCSTIAVPTPTGPVVARNMDWWPEQILAKASCLIRLERNGELQFCNAGWPGATGVVTGLSGRGFAIALNAVTGPEGVDRAGYPVLLHVRRVLEDAKSFEQAFAMLTEQRLAAPALFMLVGSTNEERVVIERSPRRFALRWGEENQPLIVTNDYRELFPPVSSSFGEIYLTTCTRFDFLTNFLREHDFSGDITEAKLLYILTEHPVVQGITAQHILMRPRNRQVKLFVPRKHLEVD